MARSFEPRYLQTHESGALADKVQRALEMLRSCRVCPRDCNVNRLDDEFAVCHSGRYARVASCFPHFGEEDCLRGWRGLGTIFFSMCNLRCAFCQNWDISQVKSGPEVPPDRLASLMLELQEMGCHNINFVTPEHVVPQVVEALPIAIEKGLRLPIVYNTSAFDSPESLEILDGLVDVYMPDFKYWDPEMARRYVKAVKYPEVARHSIKEMHRQVGDLVLDGDGLAVRGLLVRHLVMPGLTAGTRQIMRFLVNEVSPDVYVNVMAQYHPAGKSEKYPEIDRPTSSAEHAEAVRMAREEGVHRFDSRDSRFDMRRMLAGLL